MRGSGHPGSFPEVAAVLGGFGADFGVPGPFPFQKLTPEIPNCGFQFGFRFGVVILKDLKVLVCHGFWLAVDILVQVFDGFCLLSHFPITFSVGDTNWAYLRLFLYILVTF